MTTMIKPPLKDSHRSLGSAKHGTHHWWMQRTSAVGLVILGLWFLFSLYGQTFTYNHMITWIQAPHRAIAMILLLSTGFYHGYLGLQVVIEDYVHHSTSRIIILWAAKFLCGAAAVAGIFSVIKLATGH